MSRIVALIAAAGFAGALATSAQAAPLGGRTIAATAPTTIVTEVATTKKITKKKRRARHSCPY